MGKFQDGELVFYTPRSVQEQRGGAYTILRARPVEVDGRASYHIKCQADGHERVVTEDQLERLATA